MSSWCSDIICVKHPHGFVSSQLELVISKKVRTEEEKRKAINVFVNGALIPGLKMKTMEDGTCVFIRNNSKRIPSDVIQQLSLSSCNDLAFECPQYSSASGRFTIRSKLYLYDQRERLVVMDIDGTMTRSDNYGHLMSALGISYLHKGLGPFLSTLARHFRIVYLTGRPANWLEYTRRWLRSVEEGSRLMPEGPVFSMKCGLVSTVMTELSGGSKMFKVGVLESIQDLFDGGGGAAAETSARRDCCFACGFGNTPLDAAAYSAVGIRRVFTINASSEIFRQDSSGFMRRYSSYSDLLAHITDLFPEIQQTRRKSPMEIEKKEVGGVRPLDVGPLTVTDEDTPSTRSPASISVSFHDSADLMERKKAVMHLLGNIPAGEAPEQRRDLSLTLHALRLRGGTFDVRVCQQDFLRSVMKPARLKIFPNGSRIICRTEETPRVVLLDEIVQNITAIKNGILEENNCRYLLLEQAFGPALQLCPSDGEDLGAKFEELHSCLMSIIS